MLDQNRLMGFEMKCYLRIVHIRWKQKITNHEVRRRVEAKENIYLTVMRRKPGLFGHICRMDNARLLKLDVFGQMDRTNKRG